MARAPALPVWTGDRGSQGGRSLAPVIGTFAPCLVLSWAAFTVRFDGGQPLAAIGWHGAMPLPAPASALVPRRASIEGNLAAVVGQLQLGEQTGDAGSLRVDSREILAATTRLIGARLGELEVDTHIVVTTRYIERGTPDDFLVDLTNSYGDSFVKAQHRMPAGIGMAGIWASRSVTR